MVFYFVVIVMGVFGGILIELVWYMLVLMGVMFVVLFVGDYLVLFRGMEHHRVVLDQAYTDRAALITRLEADLGAEVKRVEIKRVDMVASRTTVEVRYRRG